MVATHPRFYSRGETIFELVHYLPLLELKPRSVFHAKPVRRTAAHELLAWGKLFPGGAKDTVQLLKLSVEYGLERVLAVKEALPAGITPTIDLVRHELKPHVPVELTPPKTSRSVPLI